MDDLDEAVLERQKPKSREAKKARNMPGDEGIIAGIRGLDQWRRAWARAVAFAWESKEHEKELLKNPEKIFEMFDYEIPPGLKVKVEKYKGDNEYKYKPGKNGWLHMEDELSGEVTMILPPAPKKELQALALADYDATGKTYPFTCC